MNSAENTHGPWRIERLEKGKGPITIKGEGPGIIAFVYGEENAQFIATAPNVLEALKEARKNLEDAYKVYPGSPPWKNLEAIDKAIAQALGKA
ncbi:hypothetical protein [Desulfovibrio ferrophilus]|uniref:Uncharacterized protein n=1 Tax=Desulfovibrio ferrophilus TaxID=241368 RepID=A0A2Z6B3L2_9BACT|nr:hypothetical protein [Desulfovibrio ferrophilus]BBD10109.1 uncharacterized protein DFE_A0008 [Desulfovibrio ferrophilus]